MSSPSSNSTAGARMRGPLAPFVLEVRLRLSEAGYTPFSSVNTLQVVAHLSRWLEANRLGIADLNEERLAEFFTARRGAGHTAALSPLSLAPLFPVFRAHGAPLAHDSPSDSARDGEAPVISRFRRYLMEERGLQPPTVYAYTTRAARFLAACGIDGRLGRLAPSDVTAAVLAESRRVSVGAAQYFAAAVRCFLRFCRIEGLVQADLSWAALSPTGRRRSGLPRGIQRSDAEAILRACDRRTAVGRRDYAVLAVLMRLGLRAGEVAGLKLDDIDWDHAEMVIRGKGQREDRLPLPADVGKAIVAYLRHGRPKTTRREIFMRAIAPHGGIGRGNVSSIVRRACKRAGVLPVGAHRLRHTLACEMVGAGVSLQEIAQVLRHASVSSTAIYAKADIRQLRVLARPWPKELER